MSQTVEIEFDDVHELMFAEVADEEVSIDEWAQETVTTLLYQNYKAAKNQE